MYCLVRYTFKLLFSNIFRTSNPEELSPEEEGDEGENKDELDISIDDSWSQINEYLLDRYGDVTNSSDSNYKIEIDLKIRN